MKGVANGLLRQVGAPGELKFREGISGHARTERGMLRWTRGESQGATGGN
jgi:hypothetical protein